MSIKNSPNICLSDEDTRKILIKFLEGEIILKELQEAFNGHITIDFDFAPNRRIIKDIHLNENVKVQVTQKHLCQMIRKYIKGIISDLEFSNWAAFILMSPFFMPKGETEEEQWEEGDSITWEIIQKIASPNIFEEINITNEIKNLELLACNQKLI